MKNTYSVPPDEQIERMSFSQINSLISDVLNTAQKVKDKTEDLPKVENNPESRTFSEKEYAEKDELAEQLKLMIENIHAREPVIFRTNHASNYLPLRGTLPRDKDMLLKTIEAALNEPGLLRHPSTRGL